MRRLGLCWALLALFATAPAHALDFGEGPVLLFADRISVDRETNVIRAEGNVEVVRAERRLLADVMQYDQDDDQIEATGNVILLDPSGDALYADRVTLSGDFRNGVAEQLRARLTDNSLAAAAQGRRIDGTRTELDRAVYSPCPLCPDSDSPPLWQITAQRIIHDQQEKTITYRNAFFELYGVPIAYTPYLSHPDPSVE
ncbi:MAG TPA: LptA/OstA family protein, partial [Geminicoccaceae bacterium]|nr:LptA/OstA family protein [Geminicoccaceae bacterium]